MLLQEAIKLRILELAAERGYSVNKLAERSGIAPSALKKTVKPYATVKGVISATPEPVKMWLDIIYLRK